MAGMTREEREARLQRGGACRIGCLDASGAPYVVPVAFSYVDGAVRVVARARAAWAAHLRRDGRISVCIDGDEAGLGNWRIQIQGRAEVVVGPVPGEQLSSYAALRAQAARDGWLDYFLAVSAEPYIEFVVRAASVTTWRGNDWAARYKHGDWRV